MLLDVTPDMENLGLQDLQAKLRSEATRTTWGELAASYGVNKGILWRIANGNYEPRRATIRAALGLPPIATVDLAPGVAIASGAILMVSSSICPCGRSFIPNHPSRTHCPTCRPPRKRERRLRWTRH